MTETAFHLIIWPTLGWLVIAVAAYHVGRHRGERSYRREWNELKAAARWQVRAVSSGGERHDYVPAALGREVRVVISRMAVPPYQLHPVPVEEIRIGEVDGDSAAFSADLDILVRQGEQRAAHLNDLLLAALP